MGIHGKVNYVSFYQTRVPTRRREPPIHPGQGRGIHSGSQNGQVQNAKHAFLLEEVGLSSTEYLEALNRATSGGVVKAALWNS